MNKKTLQQLQSLLIIIPFFCCTMLPMDDGENNQFMHSMAQNNPENPLMETLYFDSENTHPAVIIDKWVDANAIILKLQKKVKEQEESIAKLLNLVQKKDQDIQRILSDNRELRDKVNATQQKK